jgi:hypothetical protein
MEEQVADFLPSRGPAVADVQRELSVMRGASRRQSADRTTCAECGSLKPQQTYRRSEEWLLAENTELANRVRRLSPVLVSMARDLAAARRENAALKRKNGQLRRHVTTLDQTSADPILEAAVVARRSPAPAGPGPPSGGAFGAL